MEDEIFVKPKTEEKKKPKRKLTEKQLQALARGREKRKQKLLEKQNKQAEKDMVKEIKEGRKGKKQQLKEQKQVKLQVAEMKEDHKKELAVHDKNSAEFKLFKSRFNEMKYETLDKIEDKATFRHVKKYFANIKLNQYEDIDAVKEKMKNDITKLNTFVNKTKE